MDDRNNYTVIFLTFLREVHKFPFPFMGGIEIKWSRFREDTCIEIKRLGNKICKFKF